MRHPRFKRPGAAPAPQFRTNNAGARPFFLLATTLAFEPETEFVLEWFHRLDGHLRTQGLAGAISPAQAFVIATGRPLHQGDPAAVLDWVQAQPEVLRARIAFAPSGRSATAGAAARSAHPVRLSRCRGGASQ